MVFTEMLLESLIEKKLKAKKDVKGFIKALDIYYPGVEERAAEALREIGEPAVEPLIKALGDSDEYVRKKAAEALGKIGDARAVKPLIKALGDSDMGVRENAAWALGEIGDARAVDALSELVVHDKNKYVREAARDALRKLKPD